MSMSSNRRRNVPVALACGLAMVTVVPGWSRAADPGAAKIAIISVRPVPVVRVRVIIRNGTASSVSVPYCGDASGTDSLCGPKTRLEVRSRGSWEAAKTAPGAGLLGWPMPQQRATIPAGGELTFEFEFSRNSFAIRTGATLRLVVQAEKVMNEGGISTTEIELRSEPFLLP